MWTFIGKIIQQPTDKIILISAVILLAVSFFDINLQAEKWAFKLTRIPNWYLFVPGAAMLCFFFWCNRIRPLGAANMTKTQAGFSLRFDSNHVIDVVFGKIEDVAPAKHAAVVLPANTSFDDECIKDDRSALGSFFLKHFPTAIDKLQAEIRAAAAAVNSTEIESFTEAPPGTTILLHKPMGTDFNVMVTAVTVIEPDKGIAADTATILASIKQVLRKASVHRISSIAMPVMGTGHGGLDFKSALSLALVQSMHCMRFEGCHHVKEVTMVVFDPDNSKRALVKSAVDSIAELSKK